MVSNGAKVAGIKFRLNHFCNGACSDVASACDLAAGQSRKGRLSWIAQGQVRELSIFSVARLLVLFFVSVILLTGGATFLTLMC